MYLFLQEYINSSHLDRSDFIIMSNQVLSHYPEVNQYFHQHYELSISTYTGEDMFVRQASKLHNLEIKQTHPPINNSHLSIDAPTKPKPSDTPRPEPNPTKPNEKGLISIFHADQVSGSPFGYPHFLCTDTNYNIPNNFSPR
jgi:hypothetical protein